jgi:hypothetical protein
MKTRIDHKKEESFEDSVSSESGHSASDDDKVRQRIAVRAYELYRERGPMTGMISTTGWKPSKPLSAPKHNRRTSGEVSCSH